MKDWKFSGNWWDETKRTTVRQAIGGWDKMDIVLTQTSDPDTIPFYRILIDCGRWCRLLATFMDEKKAEEFYESVVNTLEIYGEGDEL